MNGTPARVGTYSQQDLDLNSARFGGRWVAYKYKHWLPLEVPLLSGVQVTIYVIVQLCNHPWVATTITICSLFVVGC